MHPQERMAWFILAVLLLTLIAYFTLLILTRNPEGSQAAFAISALLGFGGLFAVGRKGKIEGDEHDRLIALKAGRAGFIVFWFYFIAYGLLSMRLWDHSPTMPSYLMSTLIWTGLCVLMGAQSIATLIYYRTDATEKVTMVDRIKHAGNLRLTGVVMLSIFLFVVTPFALSMILVSSENLPSLFIYLSCAGFAMIYIGFRSHLGKIELPENEKLQLARAQRTATIAFAVVALSAGAGVTALVQTSYKIDIRFLAPRVVFFVIVAGIISLALSLIRHGGRENGVNPTTQPEAPDA